MVCRLEDSLRYLDRLFALFALLVSVGAGAQTLPSVPWSEMFNVQGAVCNGVTDDTAAFNAALSAVRSKSAVSGTLAWPVGKVAILSPPHGKCVISSTLNATSIYGSGFVWDGTGSTLICSTNGTPCIDATGEGQVTFENLNIYGTSTNTPNIGIAIGRVTNNGVGADHLVLNHPTVTGYFTLAAFFNNQSETTLINGAWFENQQANAYSGIFDGQNYFNFQTIATGGPYPQNTFYSFNENTCVECTFGTYGTGSIPLWIGGTARLKLTNGYVFNSPSSASSPVPGVLLYYGNGVTNDFLDLDVHLENNGASGALNAFVMFAGASVIVQNGLHIRDNYPEQAGPLFSHDSAGIYGTAVSTVTITDVNLEFGTLAGASHSWWDTASAFTVDGYIFDKDNSFTAPGTFQGQYCIGTTGNCSFGTTTSQIGANSLLIGPGAGANATGAGEFLVGPNAGRYISSGANNFGFGLNALQGSSGALQTGGYNTAVGVNSLINCQGGCSGNVAVGNAAGAGITTSTANTLIGTNSGNYLTTGSYETALGYGALQGVSGTPITGSNNTAAGLNALTKCQGACASNTAAGALAGSNVTTATNDTFAGANAGLYVSTGPFNSGFGAGALQGISGTPTTGGYNTASGAYSLLNCQGGCANNTASGFNSGLSVTTQANNALFGINAGEYLTAASSSAFGAYALTGISGTPITGSSNSAFGYSALTNCQGACANNTASGYGAGNQITTGTNNSLYGENAGQYISTGGYNTAIGMTAMNGSSGAPTTGGYNTATGYGALYYCQGACANNTATGYNAGYNITTGTNGVYYGQSAGSQITSGANNTALGTLALQGSASAPTTGNNNTAVGASALLNCQGACSGNTGTGYNAGAAVTTGSFNTFNGSSAGQATTTGAGQTAVGYSALYSSLTDNYNTGLGFYAGYSLSGANYNTFLGANEGRSVTTGGHNTLVGALTTAGTLTTGTNNTIVGYGLDVLSSSTSNEVNLGGLLFLNANSTATTNINTCGTSATIDSHANNKSGTVTAGTGTFSSCVINFAGSGYSTWNHCRVTPHGTYSGWGYSYNLTTLTATATAAANIVFDYDCDGY